MRNIRLCTDLTNHLSQRIRHVCSEILDTADRAGLSNGELASVVLTALACHFLVDAATIMKMLTTRLRGFDKACPIGNGHEHRNEMECSAKPDIRPGFAVSFRTNFLIRRGLLLLRKNYF